MEMKFISQQYKEKVRQSIYEKHKANGLTQYPERIFKMMDEYAEYISQQSPDAVDTATVTGIFTKEQQDYVASVSDENLRSHLLHQVRLRDNMESDRNAFEKLYKEALSPSHGSGAG